MEILTTAVITLITTVITGTIAFWSTYYVCVYFSKKAKKDWEKREQLTAGLA